MTNTGSPVAGTQQDRCGRATASLALGILSIGLMIGIAVLRLSSKYVKPYGAWKDSDLFALDVLLCLLEIGAGITGFILGLTALGKIRRSKGLLRGRGKAITGVVLCSTDVIIGVLATLIAILLPSLAAARMNAKLAVSMANMNGLCKAALVYAGSHDNRLPPAEAFPTALQIPDHMLKDRFLPEGARGYSMNAKLSNAVAAGSQASTTVLFFECRPDAPCAGERPDLRVQPGHWKGYVIGFLDGHVEVVAPRDVDGLVWSPTD